MLIAITPYARHSGNFHAPNTLITPVRRGVKLFEILISSIKHMVEILFKNIQIK